MAGASLAMTIYHFAPSLIFALKKTSFARDIFYFLNRKWFFDRIYNEWLAQPALWFGYTITFKTLDKGGLEFFGPAGVTALGKELAHRFSRFQTGFLFHYAFVILLSTLLFLFLLLIGGLSFYLCLVLGLFFLIDTSSEDKSFVN
jgi:NADH-ubiquinone oxidoreductase chain 5